MRLRPALYVTKVSDSTKPAGDRPASAIEITPQMIEAGVRELIGTYYGDDELCDLRVDAVVSRVFGAMDRARPRPSEH